MAVFGPVRVVTGESLPTPRRYLGVMVSSTFRDLRDHRDAVIQAILGNGLHPIAMEHDSALPDVTVVESSLQKVQDAAAYIGIVGYSYGQVRSAAENPQGWSLTELEFREARRLGRPTLIFIMSGKHPVPLAAVEAGPEEFGKLALFREEVKRASNDSSVERVYREFDSLQEFKEAVIHSVAELRPLLDARAAEETAQRNWAGRDETRGIPTPPEPCADPPYIGGQCFVGRADQLGILGDWAAPADHAPVLLFDAIGGTGKSALTWEWFSHRATDVRGDWAGRFWYSFYEKGAVMTDFCRRALAYITGRPLDDFAKVKQADLTDQLLWQLRRRPWLLVLDGLERVLVAYHRHDAAQLSDEEVGTRDIIAARDPRAAIRPLDEELLRRLAAAGPSKILITSRLVPQALLGPAGRPIPGVRCETLPGLQPVDAEALLRSYDVDGDSGTIRGYLHRHCDCHPLVTGVIAGLVLNYPRAHGQFDRWAADPAYGGGLDIGGLNLVGKRNHILHAAIDALPEPDRRLLSMLALLSEATDYDTIEALNPHLPAEPDSVPAPEEPEDDPGWADMAAGDRVAARAGYEIQARAHHAYLEARRAWERSVDRASAAQRLDDTVGELEKRGLLQIDRRNSRYDLHPVVRSVAAGLPTGDRDLLGQRVIDHFSSRPQNPYTAAETIDDLRNPLTVIRTLLRLGRFPEASLAYTGEFADALFGGLEAYAEMLALLRPFFTHDWTTPSPELDANHQSRLVNDAGLALGNLGEHGTALAAKGAGLKIDLTERNWRYARVGLSNCAGELAHQNHLASAGRLRVLALGLAEHIGGGDSFYPRLDMCDAYVVSGRMDDAERTWAEFSLKFRDLSERSVQAGAAVFSHACYLFERGTLTGEDLSQAVGIAAARGARRYLRGLQLLRGWWLVDRGQWADAADSLETAVRMAREVEVTDAEAETLLALARHHLGRLADPRTEAERLAALREPAHLHLAHLWQAIGDTEQAICQARAAYRYAWADGEPHVRRHDLNRATALLHSLGVEIPRLPAYDPATDPPPDWEEHATALVHDLLRSEDAQSES
ncbi:DUF4062 domain-containing protein [Frankia sp. AgB32]|uniref:DUF4062 domain-containing protein n=1 Tax=Frankia sp. AgB32 TaxID=631119 RepID=UPI00200CFF55|nr:DUF4062 domain-containing protein [Frankia sp. AgB32]MCK9895603.1 DUF4062 domain-containing protein [Frankia sp. AgB32]